MDVQTEKSLHYGVTAVVNSSARWRYEMADTFANHYETASNFELPEHSYEVPTQSVSRILVNILFVVSQLLLAVNTLLPLRGAEYTVRVAVL